MGIGESGTGESEEEAKVDRDEEALDADAWMQRDPEVEIWRL